MQVDRLLERTRRGLEPSRVGERVTKVGNQVDQVLPMLGFRGLGRLRLANCVNGSFRRRKSRAGVALLASGVGQRVQSPGEDHRVGLRLGEVGGEPGEINVNHMPTLGPGCDVQTAAV